MNALLSWLKDEWRLMLLPNWQTEYRQTESAKPEFFPCSHEDPRCQTLDRKREAVRHRMRQLGIQTMLEGKKTTSSAATDIGALFDEIRRVRFGNARRIK